MVSVKMCFVLYNTNYMYMYLSCVGAEFHVG